MLRMCVAAVLGMLVAGCSLGTQTLSLGFNGSDPPASSRERQRAQPSTLGADTARQGADKRTRTAALDDRAPTGSFEKAPRGALSDRDYAATRLDAEQARDLINAYRRAKGLKPLSLNAELTLAAKAHSRDLARWDRISHFGSDGSTPWDRVKRTGYNAKLAAENVGTGQVTIEEVMKGWQESPGHNKNLLLTDADHMGIALVQDPKTEFKTFWTLVLGSRL